MGDQLGTLGTVKSLCQTKQKWGSYIPIILFYIAQSAEAVEYANFIFAER